MKPASVQQFTNIDPTEQPADRRRLPVAPTRVVAPFASDPELTMRREIKLLRIEVEQLRALEEMSRAENGLLRAGKDEARKAEAFLLAYVEQVEQLRQSRDYWEGQAKSLSGKPDRWFYLRLDRRRILGRLRTVLNLLAVQPDRSKGRVVTS